MAPKDSPLIHQLRGLQFQQIGENIESYQKEANHGLKRDSMQLALFTDTERLKPVLLQKINASVIDSRSRGVTRSGSVNYINLDIAVAEKIKSDVVLMSNPKKVGVINKDSLLGLLPGYQENKMVQGQEKHDSKSSTIAQRDSAHNAENYQRYAQAIEKFAVSKELFIIQDTRDAAETWKEQPAVLVNVNADVTKELGL